MSARKEKLVRQIGWVEVFSLLEMRCKEGNAHTHTVSLSLSLALCEG